MNVEIMIEMRRRRKLSLNPWRPATAPAKPKGKSR
jgi:hypothetical protein